MAIMNEEKKYLLNRLPGRYSLKRPPVADPPEVKKARKVVDDFAARLDREHEERQRKYNKAVKSAREAIYFKDAQKALEAIKAIETEFDGYLNHNEG